MANYANLLAQIAANIYSNNNQEITGDGLQLQLNAMVASLGAGYQFMGVAHPADTPSGYADLRAFWLAGEAGTYTNFGGLVLSDGEVAVIKYDGNGWTKEVTGAITADKLNHTKYNGYVMPFSDVDDTTIQAEIGAETSNITIKRLIYCDHINSNRFLYPQQATLNIPSDANMVVLGVIVNPMSGNDSGHYGYYSISSQSSIQDNEVFRPICLCLLYGGKFELRCGPIADKLFFKNLNGIQENTVKEPSFKYGLISNAGDWYDNPAYKCSDLLPCDLIGGFKSAIASTISLNFYNEDGSYAGHETASFIDGVAKLTTNYKYVRFWAAVANYDSISIIWIKEFLEQQLQNLELSDNKSSNIIYTNECISLNKLGAINLLNNQAATPSDILALVSGGIQISQNYAFWPLLNSRINNAWTRIVINTASAGSFILRNYGMENGAQGLTTLAYFDLSRNLIQLYNNPDVIYTFDSNTDYRIDIHRIDKFNQLFVTNLKTGVKTNIDTYEGQTAGATGLMYDIVAIGSREENSIIVKSYSIESGVFEPKLMIFGDSITAGYYATIVDGVNTNCYAHKIGEASQKNWLSSARGGGGFDGFMGGTDNLGFNYEGRLWREIKRLRPNYVMVTLGTNGGGTYAQYKSVIDTIIKAGATPILNTLPIRADVDHIHNVDYVANSNAIIMQIWKDYGINGVRFDLATSLNNDGETIDTSLYVYGNNECDYIHPNDLGHNAMYQRALIDCPYLFV